MNKLLTKDIHRLAFQKGPSAIAKELGCKPKNVTETLIRHNWITEDVFGDLNISEVWQRLQKGQSFVSMASEFGYNADRLRDWFWKNGAKYFKSLNPTTQRYE